MKKQHITLDGYKNLQKEANHLWHEKRPVVLKALAAAAAEGDRSENAEYIYRKKQLGGIDRRLRYLSKKLDALTVVTEKPKEDGKIYFGCYVTLEDEEGVTKRYRIVGPDEWDIERDEISINSPLGKVLIGKQKDDEVLVRKPGGDAYMTIMKVAVNP